MKVHLIIALLLLILGSAPVASAQDRDHQIDEARPPVPPPGRPRVSADQLLQGQPLPASFGELQPILERGHEVVVWDAAGRKTRGRVSSISPNQVVVFREGKSPLLRLFIPPQERALSADSVARIDIVDPAWNGALVGAAIAPVLVFGIHRWEESAVPDSNNMKGLLTIVFGGISSALSVGVGYWVDSSINDPIYTKQSRLPRVTIVPWLEHNGIGVMVQTHFR